MAACLGFQSRREPAFREALVFTVGADSLYTRSVLTGEPVTPARS